MSRRPLLHFIHTDEFEQCLIEVPVTDAELREVQRTLQANPESGKAIAGTGGVRKLRAAVKGKGKRGGARILYFYAARRRTIYLMFAYDKSEADSISDAGKRALRTLARRLDGESE